jgi:hypothetical protein
LSFGRGSGSGGRVVVCPSFSRGHSSFGCCCGCCHLVMVLVVVVMIVLWVICRGGDRAGSKRHVFSSFGLFSRRCPLLVVISYIRLKIDIVINEKEQKKGLN